MPYVLIPDNFPAGITLDKVLELTEQARKERKRITNIECLRRYRERHHDEILEQQKNYREANREILNKKKCEYRARQKLQAGIKSHGEISSPNNFLAV
jgi:hypothetical protein